MQQLPPDFREFIELMIAAGVEFVMIGGWAYNLYRNPRATGDIDFLVSPSPANQVLMRGVLIEFGFGSVLPPETKKLFESDKVVMLGRSPFRIDLMTEIDGVSFSEVKKTATEIELDGVKVPVISPSLLLKNKLASGRPKDLADAEELRIWFETRGDLDTT